MLRGITLRILALLIPMAALSSCSTLDSLLGEERPRASIESVALSGITLDAAQLAVGLRIENPYSVALPVAALEASLSSSEQRIVSTRHDGMVSVPPRGSAVVPLEIELSFIKILKTATSLRPGSTVPYRADVTVSVDAPVLGRVAIPLSHDGEFPIPAPPGIHLRDMVLDKVGLQGVVARISLDLANANDFPMDDAAMDMELRIGDRSLSRLRRLGDIGSLAPGQSKSLDLGFSLSATEVGLGLIDLLAGRSAKVRAMGNMGFDTSFGPISTEFDSANDVPIRQR